MAGTGATAAAGWRPVECTPEIHRHGDGGELSVLVWRFPRPLLSVSSAPLGGGLGVRNWVVNAQVPHDYARLDPDAHLGALALGLGLQGPGVGMLTAVDVRRWSGKSDTACRADASVGTTDPTWAAAADQAAPTVGTINLVVLLAVRLCPAALVNTVVTATEAKSQALWDAGIAGTGTPSDALCVACPDAGHKETFGGPRSPVGSSVARAVHGAVLHGCRSEAGR